MAVEPKDEGFAERAGPARRLMDEIEAGLIGRGPLVERLMIALLVGGRVLVEGAPGLAKTRAVRRLSDGLEGSFARIQCTPDLMPSDVTGTQFFRPADGTMEFLPGPVFNALVLVDEINRAPPKVQSALLEAMAEQQVTAGGRTRPLPDGFIVVATQNPLEHEGTFPLPEAQLDRFLFHVSVGMPDEATELGILDLVEGEAQGEAAPVTTRLSNAVVAEMRKAVTRVHLSSALKQYIVQLVMATRRVESGIGARVEYPVSPRGTLALAAAARARAFLMGRDFAIPEDVAELATDVMAHRMAPTWRARADGDTARAIVADTLQAVAPL
jgi:MoxR-like ATPase